MIDRSSAASTAVVHGVLLVAWLGAFVASALLEYAPHASLWFPPAAITFSALLVLGVRALPVLWLACMLSAVLTNQLYDQELSASGIVSSGLVFAATHTLSYGSIALVLRRLAWDVSPLTTLRKVTIMLIGGAFAAGLAAVAGAWGLTLTGMIPIEDVPMLLAPWWIGDYAGLLTLGPLAGIGLVALAERAGLPVPSGVHYYSTQHRQVSPLPRQLAKVAALLLVTVAVLAGAAAYPQKDTLLFLLFVAIIIQLWIVHTESELCALTAIALFSLTLVVATRVSVLDTQALMLQFVLITLAANSYLGLAVPSLFSDNQRLRELLTHDMLTGAHSRAFFEDRVRSGLDEAAHRGEPAAMVMIDLDGLKRINDRLGHAAGDQALRILAQACLRYLGPGDVLGRLSGDEFAIFLPGHTAARAESVVSAIRSDLAGQPGPVRARFGVAERGRDGASYDVLLHAADTAMYRHKS